MVQSRYRKLPCDGCLANKTHQPRVRFQRELHLGESDGFEFGCPRSFGWKRTTASPQSLLPEGTEPRGLILQPRPPVQRVLQLSVAVWKRAALRKRRHRRRGQAHRRLAVEFERPGCKWIPRHAADGLEHDGYRRPQYFRSTELESGL